MATPRPPNEYMQARLADLAGHWLEIHCGGCSQRAYWPCPLMARQPAQYSDTWAVALVGE